MKKLFRFIALGAMFTAISCGGSSSSTSGSNPNPLPTSGGLSASNPASSTETVSKLEKNAQLLISVPALANTVSKQLLPDDARSFYVYIYQYPQISSHGVLNGEYSYDRVELTPQTPSATLNLFPGFTRICINYSNGSVTHHLMCGVSELKPGRNVLTYTLVRGTWELRDNRDIGGIRQFAIKGYRYYFGHHLYDLELAVLGSSDGQVWQNLEGAYVQADYEGGGKILAFGKKFSDNKAGLFLAYDGGRLLKYRSPKYIYTTGLYGSHGVLVMKENEASFKIEDNQGRDITDSVIQSCKFETSDGKSISGCIIKDAQKSTEADYTHKVIISFTTREANICYDDDSMYDPSTGVCWMYGGSYCYNGVCQYYCYSPSYSFNSQTNRCEASLRAVCVNNGGNYDETTRVCSETKTEYYRLSIERATIIGRGSLPSSANITIQKK